MMGWFKRRMQRRAAEIDGQILRPAFDRVVRQEHPDWDDAQVAVAVDSMMQLHNSLEQQQGRFVL